MAAIKQQGPKTQKQNIDNHIVLENQVQGTEVTKPSISNWEKIAGSIFGVTFLVVLLALSVFISDPSPSQYATFKTILAIAAAGVGGILAGTIHVEGAILKWSVRAGGAMALFVIVFFFSPAPANTPEKEPDINQTIEEGGTGIIHSGKGDVNIQQ